MCVMNAHAVKVSAWGYANKTDEPYFADVPFSNETALFRMSNGATMRICEHREIAHHGREIFRVYGTQGRFENDTWCTNRESTPLTIDEMRDSLPDEVAAAFRAVSEESDIYGGHGGSHAFLVHEFVDAIAAGREPAVSIYDAARYMAAGVTAHKSALADGQLLDVPDWGDGK